MTQKMIHKLTFIDLLTYIHMSFIIQVHIPCHKHYEIPPTQLHFQILH